MLKKITIIFFSILMLLTISYAQSTGNITGNGGGTNTCPTILVQNDKGDWVVKSISDVYKANFTSNNINNVDPNDPNKVFYVNGTYMNRYQVLKNFESNQYANLSCPPKITGLQDLFLRFLVIVNTIVGLVIFFTIFKAGFLRMTARNNTETIKKSGMMIVNAIIGLIVVLSAYIGLVFLGTILLPSDSCYRYSFIDSGKILFWFDQSDISPIVGDPANCTPST